MSPLAAVERTVIALAIAFIAAVSIERSRVASALPALLSGLAAVSAVVLVALVVNHVAFPFHLDLMEGVVLQHARRAMHGQSIYPLPTPEYVPLAYNTLFYLLAAPFLVPFAEALTRSKRYHELKVTPNVIGYYSDWPSFVVLLQPHFYGEVPFEEGMKKTQEACQAIMDLPRP